MFSMRNVHPENNDGWITYMVEQTRREDCGQMEALESLRTEELVQFVKGVREGKLDPVFKQALGLKSVAESLTSLSMCMAEQIIEERQKGR